MVSVSSYSYSRAFNTIRPRPCHLGARPGQRPALSRTPGCKWTAFAPPTYLLTTEVSEGGLCVGSGASLPAARCSSCSRPTRKRAVRVPGTMGGISSGLQTSADQAQLLVWAGSGRRQALGVGTAPALFFILGGHRDLKGRECSLGWSTWPGSTPSIVPGRSVCLSLGPPVLGGEGSLLLARRSSCPCPARRGRPGVLREPPTHRFAK